MKLTQKDKALLIVLGMVIVIACTLLLPSVGIFDCREKMKEIEEDVEDIDLELKTKLEVLNLMGIGKTTASSYTDAQRELNAKILAAKKEAALLAGSILAFVKSHGVDEGWVLGLEYKGGNISNDDMKLLEITAQITPNANSDYEVDGVVYTLTGGERSITYDVAANANCEISLELTYEDYEIESIGALILYLQQIYSKGSICILSAEYDTETASGSVSLVVLMTPNDGISRYVEEITAMEAEESGN